MNQKTHSKNNHDQKKRALENRANKNHYDMIIIGGGASGLCTAIMAKTDENRILIIEHNDRVGKKILSTGNGKCNLTNLNCKVVNLKGEQRFIDNPEGIAPYYSSSDNGFAEQVISSFDADDALAFFESLGMVPLDKNDYIYPRSEQAASVLDLLRFKCEELGVDIVCGYQPVKIKKRKLNQKAVSAVLKGVKPDNGKEISEIFVIDDEYTCDKLVVATGGQSAAKTGSDGSGYEIAKAFGHTVVKPLPGLCALKCSDPFFKELAGVRTDAELSLFDLGMKTNGMEQRTKETVLTENNPSMQRQNATSEPIMTVSGNLQFNNYGISGIPVFQMSLTASRLLEEGHELLVKINLLPELEEEQLAGIFKKKNDNPFLGVLNKKLAHVIEKESYKAHPNEEEDAYSYVFTHMIQRFKVHPIETVSFEEAQTTLGGVSTEEIDPATMESKLVEGLYFTGEIVDVSGICGGYNLQWAWSTAHAVSQCVRLL